MKGIQKIAKLKAENKHLIGPIVPEWFVSDGCSKSPDKIGRLEFFECCRIHDWLYYLLRLLWNEIEQNLVLVQQTIIEYQARPPRGPFHYVDIRIEISDRLNDITLDRKKHKATRKQADKDLMKNIAFVGREHTKSKWRAFLFRLSGISKLYFAGPRAFGSSHARVVKWKGKKV